MFRVLNRSGRYARWNLGHLIGLVAAFLTVGMALWSMFDDSASAVGEWAAFAGAATVASLALAEIIDRRAGSDQGTDLGASRS